MLLITKASSFAGEVDNALLFIFVISALVLIGIIVFMVYCLIRYSRKRNPTPAEFKGNIALEITWSVIPGLIFFAMFYYGWHGYGIMRAVPKNAMIVNVIAQKWSWYFEYRHQDYGVKGSNVLKVPLGRPVKLLMKSRDVIHSLYIPAFRVKEDVVPGQENYMWFQPTEKGDYDLMCAEYCGDLHAYMYTRVEVMDADKFDTWLALPPAPEEIGKNLVQGKGGCIACHSLDGSHKVGGGPSFLGLFGRTGKVKNKAGEIVDYSADEKYIENSLLDPASEVVIGYQNIMPNNFGEVFDEKERKAIVEYLKTLRGK